MKIQKITFALLFLFILPYIAHSQLKTVFSAPEEILKKCNHFKILPYKQMVEVETFVSKSLYLYFENSVVDTIVVCDTLAVVNDQDCVYENVIFYRKKIKLNSGKIYLLNDTGKLLYKLPFDDVLFQANEQKIKEDLTPNCGLVSFSGFYDGSLMYYGFKTEFNNLAFDITETNNEAPLILNLNGKWGMMDFEGNIVANFEYDKIDYTSTNTEWILYKNNLIAKKYFLEKVKRE